MIGSETNIVGISGPDPLAGIFATETTARLLALLALYPDRTFLQKELVQLTGGSLYLVQRDLKRLEAAGLLRRTRRGRQVEYRALTAHPAFPGLRDAMLRTLALGDRLRAALADVPGIRLAFVFGSLATGDATADSDMDLMVVGDLGLRDVAERIVPITQGLGREPNIVVWHPDEFARRVREHDRFAEEIMGGSKLWMVGDDAELATMAD